MSCSVAEKHYRRASSLSYDGNSPADLPAAWGQVQSALQLEPDHLEALILAGDLALLEWDEIECSEIPDLRTGATVALTYYERALAIEPRHADPWAGRALALVWLERYEEALIAAREGFRVLPLRMSYLENPEVYQNVAESLYSDKAKALLGLGRRDEALEVLEEGLRMYPESRLLKGYRADLEPSAG